MNMLVERAKVEEKVENNGEETEKERGKVGCLHRLCARAGDSEEEENKALRIRYHGSSRAYAQCTVLTPWLFIVVDSSVFLSLVQFLCRYRLSSRQQRGDVRHASLLG